MRLLIVLGVFLFNINATAEKLDRSKINESIKNINPIPITHNNQKGVWFSDSDAEIILKLIEDKLSLALDTIDAQDIRIKSSDDIINLYKKSNESYSDLAEYNRKMLDTAMSYIPELKPPEYSWYEKPGTMFVVGMVSGIVIGGSIMMLSAKIVQDVGK